MTVTPDLLRRALALDGFDGRGAQGEMEPISRGRPPRDSDERTLRDAAALAYVFLRHSRLHVPFTLRREHLSEHRGQVSLPGGRPEAGETLLQTAWREAHEEIGLDVPGAEHLGVLHPVYIPVTHTRLRVHVAYGPDPGILTAQPDEVARIELVALDDLVDPSRRASRVLVIGGREIDVPYYDVASLFLWGATAMAMAELVGRLRAVVS